jgi:hypothetical protein
VTSWQDVADVRVWAEDTVAGYPGTPLELTDPTMSISCRWGASAASGVYTQASAGACTVTIFDPQRLLDPGNASRPGRVEPGSRLTVTVDTTNGGLTRELWGGRITGVKHDLGTMLSTVTAVDYVEQLAAVQLAEVTLPAEFAAERVARILDLAAWPADERNLTTPVNQTQYLTEETVSGSAWQLLLDVAFWELGLLWVDPAGIVNFRNRAESWSATPPAITLGGQTHPVAVITATVELGQVVNQISTTLGAGYGPYVFLRPDSIDRYGLRQNAYTNVPLMTEADASSWADQIFAYNDKPRPYLSGVRYPVITADEAEIATLVELGDVWLISETTPGVELSTAAWVVGLSHSITPTLWETTALVVPPTTTGPRATWQNSLAPWSSLPATPIPDYLYPLPTIGG